LKALATLARESLREAWLSGGENGECRVKEKDDRNAPPRMRGRPMPGWAAGRRKHQPYVPPRLSSRLLVPLVALVLLVIWVGTPPGMPSAPLIGESRVIDGDTLDVGSRRVRLAGIDAPERAQECRGPDDTPVRCGEAARKMLADLVGRGEVTCQPVDLDRYSRVIATCEHGGADLGEVMVVSGQAVSAGRYGDAEYDARAAKRGLWAGSFEHPADWRRDHQVEDASGPPQSPIVTFFNWVRNMFFR
jgi:endonuclease YncB( thermonuclease family)